MPLQAVKSDPRDGRGIGMRQCGKRRVKHSRSGAVDLNDQVADPQFTTTRLGFRKAPSVE
jgi:hypothetical protein